MYGVYFLQNYVKVAIWLVEHDDGSAGFRQHDVPEASKLLHLRHCHRYVETTSLVALQSKQT